MPESLPTDDILCESSIPIQVPYYTGKPPDPGRSGKSMCSPQFWLLESITTQETYREHRTEEYYICVCIACKEWKMTYLWESSLSKNKELKNSKYLLHCEPNSCLSFCCYPLLNIWWSLLLFQLTNFTAFPSWLHLTVSATNF